jgi:low affinity Fe/Cu permease
MFQTFARRVSDLTGSPPAFMLALGVVVAWALAGPFLGFSEIWQLTINTGTTIVTFLMVFLIQASQNADTDEMRAELRELVRALPQADERVIPEEHV